MNKDTREMVAEWGQRVSNRQIAHFEIASRFNKYHYVVGVPATICMAVTSAVLFMDTNNLVIETIVGCIGLISAVLCAVQTFYSHARRGEQHRTTAASLGRIRREIELFELYPPRAKKKQEERLSAITSELSKIDLDAPALTISNYISSAAQHVTAHIRGVLFSRLLD